MRSPLRIPPAELDRIITKGVDEYMREVRRLKRLHMRNVIAQTNQDQGLPVPDGEDMETHIDVMEALCEAAHNDLGQVQRIMAELAWLPDGTLPSDQLLHSLHRRLEAAPPPVTNADLERYRFEITSKISARCTECRRSCRWTPEAFMFRHNAYLRRILIGDVITCSCCHTGHIKVYGVKAVLCDSAPTTTNLEPVQPKKKGTADDA